MLRYLGPVTAAAAAAAGGGEAAQPGSQPGETRVGLVNLGGAQAHLQDNNNNNNNNNAEQQQQQRNHLTAAGTLRDVIQHRQEVLGQDNNNEAGNHGASPSGALDINQRPQHPPTTTNVNQQQQQQQQQNQPLVPREVIFQTNPQTVGRNHDNDVVLENYDTIPLLISRTHAVLYREDELEDSHAAAAAAAAAAEAALINTANSPGAGTPAAAVAAAAAAAAAAHAAATAANSNSGLRSRFFVEDNGSMNGTYVNGEPIPRYARVALRDRDIVTFGGPEEVIRAGRKVENPYRFYFDEAGDGDAADAPAAANDYEEADAGAPAAANENAAEGAPVRETRASAGRAALVENNNNINDDDDDDVVVSPLLPARQQQSQQEAIVVAASDDDDGNSPQHERGDQQESKKRPAPEACTSQPPPPVAKRRKTVLNPVPGSEPFYKEMESEWQCPICQDWLVGAHAIGCGHNFCGECIFRWREKSEACPVCRCTPEGPPVPVRSIDAMIERICVPHMSESDRKERDARREAIESKVRNRLERARRCQATRQRGGDVAHALQHMLTNQRGDYMLEELMTALRQTSQSLRSAGHRVVASNRSRRTGGGGGGAFPSAAPPSNALGVPPPADALQPANVGQAAAEQSPQQQEAQQQEASQALRQGLAMVSPSFAELINRTAAARQSGGGGGGSGERAPAVQHVTRRADRQRILETLHNVILRRRERVGRPSNREQLPRAAPASNVPAHAPGSAVLITEPPHGIRQEDLINFRIGASDIAVLGNTTMVEDAGMILASVAGVLDRPSEGRERLTTAAHDDALPDARADD